MASAKAGVPTRTSSPEQRAAKAEYDRARRARLKDQIAAEKRAYYLANKDAENARVAAWVEANKARSREIKNAWKARNPDAETDAVSRARRAEYMVRYRAAHPETHRRNQSLRRAKISHATPVWANQTLIKAMYAAARNHGLEVDHIVPLKGRLVSGLHVENNLQLLTPQQNKRKGNHYAD